jgi:hypothetical protein
MDRRKYSDQGKGQATPRQKAPDVARRVAEDTERQSFQNKPEIRQRRTSSRESTSGLKKLERRLEELHVSKPRERNFEGQQQRQGDRHTSNSHQAQRYATQQHWRLMQRNSQASKFGDTGQMRRRLRGGNDPEDTSKRQEDTSKQASKKDYDTYNVNTIARLEAAAGRETQEKTAQLARDLAEAEAQAEATYRESREIDLLK